MTTLTKADLAERLFTKVGLNKKEAKDFIEHFFEIMCHVLETGDEIKLSKFGNFITRFKGARPGRNPKTGDPVEITARTVVTFHAGQKLKARVEQYNGEDREEEGATS